MGEEKSYEELKAELENVYEQLDEAKELLQDARELLDDVHCYDTDIYYEIGRFLYGEEEYEDDYEED